MAILASNWTVVVVGFWNRAILTPSGIGTRLFKVDEKTPVEVFVPLDSIAPYRVRHNGIVVMAASDRLLVEPRRNNYADLCEAMRIAQTALNDLPQTPFFAAGFNIVFQSESPCEALKELAKHDWDEQLSDKGGYEIVGRQLGRSLARQGGTINASVTQEQDLSFKVNLNFDRKSQKVDELTAWLDVSPEGLKAEVHKLLIDCIGISEEDVKYDD